MSTTTAEGSRTKDGSYLTLEWSVTISRYKHSLLQQRSVWCT